jgi:OmpA-OmpF porin, OOP family
MATFDKVIQEIGSRFCLGPKSCPLVQETLDLVTGQPGGVGSFLNRLKATGLSVEVASWLGGRDPVPLSGQEVERTLGRDAVSAIADKIGVSQIFARTVLGHAIPEIIVLLARRRAVPSAITRWAASFRDSAIPLSSADADEITEHLAKQFRLSRTEYGLAPALVPCACLLITLGLLLGYFIGAGDRGAIQSAPIVAQNAPVAFPHAPSIPARLALNNENGLITYSGIIGSDATRAAVIDSLKTVFGARRITGDLAVDLNAGPAHWAKDLNSTLDNFKIPGLEALFEGNAASVGGTIPDADRHRIISSLKSFLGPQFELATITASSPAETPTASSTLSSGFSAENPIGAPNQPTRNFPTIYFATNSAEVSSGTKVLAQQAAGLMKQLPAGRTVRISGYTDSAGTWIANMRLSQRRANAVRQVLIDEGVNPAMLSAKGYGSSHSLTSKNGTVEGRSNAMMKDRTCDGSGRTLLSHCLPNAICIAVCTPEDARVRK